MLKVDSHQHFWIFNPLKDRWITEEMSNIRRDFLPAELKPILEDNQVAGCVAVQADQSEAETMFLLNLAQANEFIKGVVGWVDLCSDGLVERLNYFHRFHKLKGFRHIVQAESPGFMLGPEFLKGISILKEYRLTFDILIRASQLEEAIKFVELNPDQIFVLDHIGKPDIKGRDIGFWEKSIRQLSSNKNVYCKLSGMVTEADLTNWKFSDLRPYMDVVLNAFGSDRIMFGSDWPVCKLAAEYEQVIGVISLFLEQLSGSERERIWSANAIECYNLDI